MYKVDYCPACHSTDIEKFPAYMYQFVAWRISGTKPDSNVPVEGAKCNNCDFTFMESRIDDAEEQALYTGYRDDEYNRMRIECEPSYAQHLLNFDDEENFKIRKYGIDTLIEKNVDKAAIKSVLDYGGNKGEHIPESFSQAERYVYDISNIELLPGIHKFDVNTKDKVDFAMCCHVLEHKSEPDVIVNEIKKFMHKDTWLYVEVPEYEHYASGSAFHEHINSFSDRSMWALLDRCGIKVVDMITTTASEGNYIMCVLGKLKDE